MLKKIECYIQPFKLDALTQALVQLGVDGMSVSEVKGFGRQHGYLNGEADASEIRKEDVKFRPKLKLEIVVSDRIVDRTVALIIKLARTGNVGAGKIFVVPVEDAVRIGTGEVGHAAIV